MNLESESSVPVAEQVEELEQADQAVEYALGSDGTIAPAKEIAQAESTPEK